MGFWMFINDQSTFGDNVINIIFENMMQISIGVDTNIATFCSVYTELFPGLATTVTMSALKSNFLTSANPNAVNSLVKFTADKSGQWFYTRCGFSLDNAEFYNMITETNQTTMIEDNSVTLPLANIYDGQTTDFRYRIYPANMNLYIKNAKTVTSNVYLRNLQLFSTYIPRTSGVHYL